MEALKIMQKWEDFAVHLYQATRAYPKSERHTLAASTIKSALAVGSELARANVIRDKSEKRRHLETADMELGRLKILIRLGMKLQFMPLKKYEISCGMLTELGSMLGGWLKAAGR